MVSVYICLFYSVIAGISLFMVPLQVVLLCKHSLYSLLKQIFFILRKGQTFKMKLTSHSNHYNVYINSQLKSSVGH